MDKIKVFAICGKAGSGKDTILKLLFELYSDSNFHKIIPCTTRPMREGESDWDPYHFVTKEKYGEWLLAGQLIEATSFRDWFYGTHLNALDATKVNIGVFNLEAIECLRQDNRLDVTIVYIDASAKARLLRQLNREDNPDVKEIIRRYGADEEDFQYLGIDYKYHTFDNSSMDKTQLFDICQKIFELTQSQSN